MKSAALFHILNSNSAYSEEIGTDSAGGVKLYPNGEVPQGTRRPYATYLWVSRTEDQNKSGRGVRTERLQIDHYASTVHQAEQLDELAFSALNRYRGVAAGVKIEQIRGISGDSGFSPDQEATRRTTDYTVRIQP